MNLSNSQTGVLAIYLLRIGIVFFLLSLPVSAVSDQEALQALIRQKMGSDGVDLQSASRKAGSQKNEVQKTVHDIADARLQMNQDAEKSAKMMEWASQGEAAARAIETTSKGLVKGTGIVTGNKKIENLGDLMDGASAATEAVEKARQGDGLGSANALLDVAAAASEDEYLKLGNSLKTLGVQAHGEAGQSQEDKVLRTSSEGLGTLAQLGDKYGDKDQNRVTHAAALIAESAIGYGDAADAAISGLDEAVEIRLQAGGTDAQIKSHLLKAMRVRDDYGTIEAALSGNGLNDAELLARLDPETRAQLEEEMNRIISRTPPGGWPLLSDQVGQLSMAGEFTTEMNHQGVLVPGEEGGVPQYDFASQQAVSNQLQSSASLARPSPVSTRSSNSLPHQGSGISPEKIAELKQLLQKSRNELNRLNSLPANHPDQIRRQTILSNIDFTEKMLSRIEDMER